MATWSDGLILSSTARIAVPAVSKFVIVQLPSVVKLAELRMAICKVVVEFDQTATGTPVLKNASRK